MGIFDRVRDFYNPKLRPLHPFIEAYGADRSVLEVEEAKGGGWVRAHRAYFAVIDPGTGQVRRPMSSSAHFRGNPEHLVVKMAASRKVLVIPWREVGTPTWLSKHLVGFSTARTPENHIQVIGDLARQLAAQSHGQWHVPPPPPS